MSSLQDKAKEIEEKRKEMTSVVVDVNLNLEEIHFLIMTLDAGLIQFHNVQNVLSNVFFATQNEKSTEDIIKKMAEIRNKILTVAKNAKEPKIKVYK